MSAEPESRFALSALSPLDGRYAGELAPWRQVFSEAALIRWRVRVEIAWLKSLAAAPELAELPGFNDAERAALDAIGARFDDDDAAAVKRLEAGLRHDVKAVERFVAGRLSELAERNGLGGLRRAVPFVHFACTSEDINNLALALALRRARSRLMLPPMRALAERLEGMASRWAAVPMLSRTHGQAASPTTLGKECANVAWRFRRQIAQLERQPLLGKCNGAVGNYNAHLAAWPAYDWEAHARRFVTGLGLEWNPRTTQIEPHDYIAELCAIASRFNAVALDWSRDCWGYVSLGYLKQRAGAGEAGSSTMPHKVNPIDFERAEGNLGIANALLGHLAEKLPLSRWQRDLSDSTALRNLGAALAYGALAWSALEQGLERVDADERAIGADLSRHPEVVAEAVQTVMRRHGIADAYDQAKAMTRGKALDRDALRLWVDGLPIPDEARRTLSALTPADYIGNAAEQARRPPGPRRRPA